MQGDNEYNDYFDEVADDEGHGQLSAGQGAAIHDDGNDDGRRSAERSGSWLRKAVAVLVAVAVVTVALWVFVIYWVPYVSEAQERGVIVELRKEGLIFDTYEGQMATDARLADTATYKRDFLFSVEDDSLAHEIMELKFSGKRVTLTYKEYRGALPWRGNSKIIVTGCQVH